MKTDSEYPPLVSIVVRSMNRVSLKETLASISNQHYDYIEVIVVAACGKTHLLLGDNCGRFPVKTIYGGEGIKLTRPQAANLGLDTARGEWLLFLDDDDTIDPIHIATLVATAESHPEAMAFYSGVRFENERGEIIHEFNHAYSQPKLMTGNFLPIHAVLFSRELLESSDVRFDETLDVFEDWDFWLQLSKLTKFHFSRQVTATYKQIGTSQVGLTNNQPIQFAMRGKFFNKWQSLFTGADIQLLADYATNLESKNYESEFSCQKLSAENQKLSAENQNLRDGLKNIYQSNSWRLTHPLRFIVRHIRKFYDYGHNFYVALTKISDIQSVIQKVYRLNGTQGLRAVFYALHIKVINAQNSDYSTWVGLYDTVHYDARNLMLNPTYSFSKQPLISVLMPTFNPKPEWLREAIESVISQAYINWELCIADDASTDPDVIQMLAAYENTDDRIKIVFRSMNGHISETSNSALEIVNGEWIALLDHDDILSEDALYRVVDTINRHPNVKLIYSDEDKITESGKRFDPYFKCEWNRDLFLSQNMISHLGVYKTQLVRLVGGFRKGFEGSQDYDLALRCVERLNPNEIKHIPKVLYHWRVHQNSTAGSNNAKPYATIAGVRALNDHLIRMGINGEAEHIGAGYRIHYRLPDCQPLVSIVMVPIKSGKYSQQTIDNLLGLTDYQNFEIIVIHSESDQSFSEEYHQYLRSNSRVSVIEIKSGLSATLLNQLVSNAKGQFIVFIEECVKVVSSDWLSEMVSLAIQRGIGAVGAKLLHLNDTVGYCGHLLDPIKIALFPHSQIHKNNYGYFGRAFLAQSFLSLSGACLLVRKEIFESIGGFDVENLRARYLDVDFCLKISERGFRNVLTPFAQLYYFGNYEFNINGASQCDIEKDTEYMRLRWRDVLSNDPSFSPNLSLVEGHFTLAWPPKAGAD